MKAEKITFWNTPPEIGSLPITGNEKTILSIVDTFTRNGGDCWATDQQFADVILCSRQTINALIRKLVEKGLLRKEVMRISSDNTPRKLYLGDLATPLSNNLTTLVKNPDYPSQKSRLPLSKIPTQIVNKEIKEIKENEASATATAHTDTATADPVTPSPQTIVELEQAIEKRIKLEETSPLKKLRKEKRKIGSLEELDLTPEVRAAAERWMDHKRAIGKPIKLPKLIAEVKKHGAGLPGVVERSIDQGWTGLFPLPKIAPWLRASSVASDWISAVGKFDPAKPGTGKASEEVINANPGLKEIIVKIRDKEQIRKSSDFVKRIKQDEFFRNRIERSIKEELTVVLTSGIGGK
jgi:hypothetical protein